MLLFLNIGTRIVHITSALCANGKTTFLNNAARNDWNQCAVIGQHVKMPEQYEDHFPTFTNTKRAEISDLTKRHSSLQKISRFPARCSQLAHYAQTAKPHFK